MKRKLLYGTLGGFIGLVIGAIGGGYFGLVIGGTFLGGVDIHQYTGIEGYELATYVGAIVCAVLATLLGIKYALRIYNRRGKEA